MATKNKDNWLINYEALKAHVAVTGHFPDKHSTLNNWVRYQRKRMKAGIMPEEQMRLFLELAESRSRGHTGGRRKKETLPNPPTSTSSAQRLKGGELWFFEKGCKITTISS